MVELKRIGLDLGTKTLVCSSRDADGRPRFKQEINGFFVFPQTDAFTRNMLVQQKIPFIERDGKFVALGIKAERFAYAINSTLRRPMAEGTISHEEEAITIMAAIVQAMLKGELGKDSQDAILYYCIPASALNKSTNVPFHDKVAKMIFDSYRHSKIHAYPINEARAIAIGSQEPVAIAISWGAGMVNVCYTLFGVPIFEFSLVGAGDWIDIETARQFGYDPDRPNHKSSETPTTICHRKQNIDLTKGISEFDRIDQAIAMHYQILIERVVGGIINGFADNIDKARIEQSVPIIMAGGTASPSGFGDYFSSILNKYTLPFSVSDIRVMDRPLYTVAEGCLIAAESHEVQ